jgi:hypothetical protein
MMQLEQHDQRTTSTMSELVVGFAPTLLLLVLVLSLLGWIALTLQGDYDWLMWKAHPEECWEILGP